MKALVIASDKDETDTIALHISVVPRAGEIIRVIESIGKFVDYRVTNVRYDFKEHSEGEDRNLEKNLQIMLFCENYYSAGTEVFHIKFGNGIVEKSDGKKLTIELADGSRKMVLSDFVVRR